MPNKYLSDPEFAAALASLMGGQDKPEPAPAPAPKPTQLASHPGKRRHLFLATPTLVGLRINYVNSMLGTISECQRRKVGFSVGLMDGCSLIGAARNNLLAQFMANKEATHMLMVDDDIGWDARDVFRMLDCDLPFMAGAVPMRRVNLAELERFINAGGDPKDYAKHITQFNVSTQLTNNVVEVDDSGIVEISWAGTAFLLVSRDAVAEMNAKCGADVYDDNGVECHDLFGIIIDKDKRTLNGEDVSFCKRWRSIGGKIHMLPDCTFSHAGVVTLSGRFSDLLE